MKPKPWDDLAVELKEIRQFYAGLREFTGVGRNDAANDPQVGEGAYYRHTVRDIRLLLQVVSVLEARNATGLGTAVDAGQGKSDRPGAVQRS